MEIPEALLATLQQYAAADDPAAVSIDLNSYRDTPWETLAISLQGVIDKATQAQETSRQFLSNVSHELRTPIAVICSYVEGILNGAVPRSQQTEILGVVDQELYRLNGMITTMLNLTKLETGKLALHCRRFTWNDLAFRTIWFFQSRLEKRQITVTGLDGEPLQIYADPDLMGQILFNLIENAVKYTDTAGTITFCFRETSDDWSMLLRNSGDGISPEQQAQLFHRFYQVPTKASETTNMGVGLGLDLVNRLTALHGGQVHVHSDAKSYTEFEVQIPKPTTGTESMIPEGNPS